MVSEIGEMTVLLGFPGQKFSRNEIIFFRIPKTTCSSGAKTKKPYVPYDGSQDPEADHG